ncbi:hypothetical protein E1B28_008215 [Marasmius oreades]|uniref:PKS/mFAS DH domain-containing protein n=1 Tax=Marasmius oreades TaxID=181124 RepID=A0A9P7RY28_9AGAR|nr:uncharacterized protein E1B28_008215 [Marasmius oreades]KAG7091812.1 hypothetical protein E1B28_008215 [Marasmius oreades]
MGHSLVQRYGLFADAQPELTLPEMWPIIAILPSLAMIQIAVLNLLRHLGVSPDVVVGHSAGEVVTFYASGSMTQETALKLAIARAVALSYTEDSSEDAGMVALGCGAPLALEIIKEIIDALHNDSQQVLDLACENSPSAVTLSGHSALLDRVLEVASIRQLFARKLHTRVAVHSAIMELCREQYNERVSDVISASVISKPRVETYSTVTGKIQTDGPTDQYMWDNTRLPVQFSSAIGLIHEKHPNAVYVEISPHLALTSYVESMTGRPVVCPLRRSGKNETYRDDESYVLLDCLGRLAVQGVATIDFTRLSPANIQGDSSILTYPFSRKPIPLLKGNSEDLVKARYGPLNYSNMKLSITDHAQLAEHVIREEAILPATGYLEMAFERGARLLWDVRFDAALPILQQPTSSVHFQLEGTHWTVESIRSQDRSSPVTSSDGKTANIRKHANGHLSCSSQQQCGPPLDIPTIRDRCKSSNIDIYHTMKYFATFGPSYRRIEKLYMGKDEGLILVRGGDSSLGSAGYIVHPILLDACLHGAVNPIFTQNTDTNSYYLPSSLKTVRVHRSSLHQQGHLWSHIKLKEWKYNELVYDIDIVDGAGQRLVELQGLVVSRHEITPALSGRPHLDLAYQRFDLPTLPSSDVAVDFSHTQLPLGTAIGRVLDSISRLGQKRVVRVLSLGSSAILDDAESIMSSNPDGFLECYFDRAHSYSLSAKGNLMVRVVASPETLPLLFDLIVVEDTSYTLSVISAMLIPGGKALIQRTNAHAEDDLQIKEQNSLRLQAIQSATDTVLIEAQKSTLSMLNEPSTTFDMPVITFELGRELDIRDQILLQEASAVPIWIQAQDDIHGGAARGFCRSLSRELSVNVRLVIFQGEWSVDRRLQFIKALSSLPGLDDEVEVLVNPNGSLYVPRFVPASLATPLDQREKPK